MGLLDELAKYVKEYHKLGLVWNPKVNLMSAAPSELTVYLQGGKATEFSSAPVASAASSIPIPPPPPPILTLASGSSSGGELTGTAAVFAQINQGSDVTKGLKKVDKSQMTHKNPALRASGTVSAKTTSPSQ
jgi:adenylyl cyclase-associated protein